MFSGAHAGKLTVGLHPNVVFDSEVFFFFF